MAAWARDPRDKELYLHVPSGVWYVRKKMKGKKPLFKTTGERTKGRARSKANELIRHWMGTTDLQFKAENILFRDYAATALADWLASDKYRPRTKDNMRQYVRELIEEIGYARITEINEVFIEENLVAKLRAKKKRTTFKDYVYYTTKVLRHAKRNGLVLSVPDFENPDPSRGPGRVYTRAEMTRIIGEAEKAVAEARASENRQRLRRALSLLAQIRCCFNDFMRKRECICAPWSEIDLATGRWVIPPERVKMGSRTGRGKEIFVNPVKTLPLLRELREIQKPSAWVFPNPRDPSQPIWDNKTAWKALKAKAGITGTARWHALRGTAMTYALLGDDQFQARLEKAPAAVQELMRREQLMNPIFVAVHSGTNIRTIEKNYVKVKAEHTRPVSVCIML